MVALFCEPGQWALMFLKEPWREWAVIALTKHAKAWYGKNITQNITQSVTYILNVK